MGAGDGAAVHPEQAAELAATYALNAVHAVLADDGSLAAVRRVVKVVGYITSVPGFTGQPGVVNGASRCSAESSAMRGGARARRSGWRRCRWRRLSRWNLSCQSPRRSLCQSPGPLRTAIAPA